MDELLDYVRDMLEPLGVTPAQVTADGDTVLVTVTEDKTAAAVIGKDGATVKALDRIVHVMARPLTGKPSRLRVDQSAAGR